MRSLLVDEDKEIRTCAIRILRYLIKNMEDLYYALQLHVDILIARCLDIVLDNRIERMQCLRLINHLLDIYCVHRKRHESVFAENTLTIPSSCRDPIVPESRFAFPNTLLRPLIALSLDGLESDTGLSLGHISGEDKLCRAATAQICELAVKCPELILNCAGTGWLIRALLGSICIQPRLGEIVAAVGVRWLNCPKFRNRRDVKLLIQVKVEAGVFESIATELESFLTVFQSQKPLAPFLFDHLLSILEALFCRIAKASVLKNLKVSELLKILRKLDSSYNGLKPVKEMDIGRGAKRTLPARENTLAELNFYTGCQAFIVGMIQKLMERCPLKYSLTRSISSLTPSTILNSPEVAKKRFEQAVDHLLDAKRITTTEADKAVKEYREFISSPETKSKLESFSETDNRLDELYYSSMGDKPQMANLWKCFKTLLLLSHGNATVERGFSVNGDILVENLVERSVVVQRTIFDALHMAGGALSINIDKEMLVKVRSSHSALKDHMEKMRKAEKEGLKGTEQRKRDLLLLKEKEAKKRKLQEEFEKASADVVALQKKVCEKR